MTGPPSEQERREEKKEKQEDGKGTRRTNETSVEDVYVYSRLAIVFSALILYPDSRHCDPRQIVRVPQSSHSKMLKATIVSSSKKKQKKRSRCERSVLMWAKSEALQRVAVLFIRDVA